MLKYYIYTFLFAACTALSIAPSARTFVPFFSDAADNECEYRQVNTLRGFSILGCLLSIAGFFLGIGSIFKPMKVACIVISVINFLFAVPNWGYAGYRWDQPNHCFLDAFPKDYFAMWIVVCGLSLIAFIIMLALPDPAESAAAAAGAEAGNVPEVKSGDEQTPQPKDDGKQAAADEAAAKKKKADEEAAAKKKHDDEAAAAAKKKADDEAAAKKKHDEDAAAAAAAKKKADDEAATKKKAEEDAAAKKKHDEDAAAAAAAKKKHEEEEEAAKKAAAAKQQKPAINWKEVNSKLPYDKKNPEQKKKRFTMFDEIDVNKTGKVSLSEVTAGMERVLQLPPEIQVPLVVKTAFDKAKVAGQQAGVNEDASGGDFIEKNEFRLFLMYTRMYFEMFQLFSALDETGDMLIEIGEFEKAIPLLKNWGAQIDDPAETFKQIDKNGGGKVLFAEFVDWALSPEQNLDCPDDDE